MEINIVGAASDEEMLEEIENITKVFVYEQHMMAYTQPLRPHPPSIRTELRRKLFASTAHPQSKYVAGYVKGFC